MKPLLKNPFFHATLVLSLILVFEVTSFVSAQTYTPAPGSPTTGQPYAPIDVSDVSQMKAGGSINISSTGGGIGLSSAYGPYGSLLFGGVSGNTITGRAGIRFNGTSLEYSNDLSTWQDIGSVSDSGWALDSSKVYTARSVLVGVVGADWNVAVRGYGVSGPNLTVKTGNDGGLAIVPRPSMSGMTIPASSHLRISSLISQFVVRTGFSLGPYPGDWFDISQATRGNFIIALTAEERDVASTFLCIKAKASISDTTGTGGGSSRCSVLGSSNAGGASVYCVPQILWAANSAIKFKVSVSCSAPATFDVAIFNLGGATPAEAEFEPPSGGANPFD
jgi:hypothetical protein